MSGPVRIRQGGQDHYQSFREKSARGMPAAGPGQGSGPQLRSDGLSFRQIAFAWAWERGLCVESYRPALTRCRRAKNV
jgi:hypothetical protein